MRQLLNCGGSSCVRSGCGSAEGVFCLRSACGTVFAPGQIVEQLQGALPADISYSPIVFSSLRTKLRWLVCMIIILPRDPCSSCTLHPDPIGFLLEFPNSLCPNWKGCMKGSKVHKLTPQSACDPPPPPPPHTHTLDCIRGSMTAERGYWGHTFSLGRIS